MIPEVSNTGSGFGYLSDEPAGLINYDLAQGVRGHSFVEATVGSDPSHPRGSLLSHDAAVYVNHDAKESIWTHAQASARGGILVVAAAVALWTPYTWHWKIAVFVAVANAIGLTFIMLEALLHVINHRRAP